jgi:protein-tyrosine phosphatase
MVGVSTELEGCLNFRDLGGHASSDGRTVRFGCLFRSGELCSLTESDQAVLRGLGIKVVVDLRSAEEQALRPQALPEDILVVAQDRKAVGSTQTLEEQIALSQIPVKDDQWVVDSYVGMLTRLAPDFRVVVQRAAEARRAPLLFHCAAGKDRTGLAAAVLLGLLGVSSEIIQTEYELTTIQYAPRRLESLRALLQEHGVSEQDIRHLLEARSVGMTAVLEQIQTTWGGFDGYARTVLDLQPELLAQLRNDLLT